MARSNKVTPKKRGRPATGRDPHVTLRLPKETIAAIDTWTKKSGLQSRSEAIRELIARSLKSLPKGKAKR